MDAPRLWLSHSPKDDKWKDRISSYISKALALQLAEGPGVPDSEISQATIAKQIDSAAVALVLLSPSFVASRFLVEHELPLVLARRGRDGFEVVPVLVEPCEWRSIRGLAELAIFAPDGRALSEIPDRDLDRQLDALGQILRAIVTDGPPQQRPQEKAGRTESVEALLFERLTPSSRRALAYANSIRLALGQDAVHMEHLFAGLYDKQDGPLRAALARVGIDEAEFSRILERATETRIPERGVTLSLERLPPHSAHVRDALAFAREIADAHPDAAASNRIRSRHLLYGALSVDRCHVTRALLERGVTRDAIPLADGD